MLFKALFEQFQMILNQNWMNDCQFSCFLFENKWKAKEHFVLILNFSENKPSNVLLADGLLSIEK